MGRDALLDRVEGALLSFDSAESLAWTQAYIDSGEDRAPLVQRIAIAACRIGNDPHNQEIAQCTLEDFGKNRAWNTDRLLLAAAQHTANHRKYGDPLDCSCRFGNAMGIERLQ